MSELARLETITTATDEPRPSGWLSVVLDAAFATPEAAKLGETRVKETVKLFVGNAQAEQLSEEEWKKRLPSWLLPSFHYLTRAKLEEFLGQGHSRDELGWHFGSWLEAMQKRLWQWWNSQIVDRTLTVEVLVEGWPYSVGALVHCIKAAGAQQVKERESPS